MTELSEGLLAYHQRGKHRVDRYAPGPTASTGNQPTRSGVHGAAQLKLLWRRTLRHAKQRVAPRQLAARAPIRLDQLAVLFELARAVGVEILRRQEVGTAP